MDRKACLLGFNVLFICGIIHVMSYEIADVKLDLTLDGNPIPTDMIGQMGVPTVKEGEQSLASSITSLEFMGIGMHKLKIMVTVPQLEDEDKCILVAGFLSPVDAETGSRRFPNKTECQRLKRANANATDMNMAEKYMPTMSGKEDVLKYPKCIKKSTLFDWSGLVEENNKTHCGLYTLVIMVDPLNFAEDDPDVCNNYLTVDIYFDCSDRDDPEPTCEVFLTGSDDKDVSLRFISHERMDDYGRRYKRHSRTFHEDDEGWDEEEDSENEWDMPGNGNMMGENNMHSNGDMMGENDMHGNGEMMGEDNMPGKESMGEKDMSDQESMREKKGKQKYGAMAKVLKAYVEGQLKRNESTEMCSAWNLTRCRVSQCLVRFQAVCNGYYDRPQQGDFKNSIKHQLDELQDLQTDKSWEQSSYRMDSMTYKDFLDIMNVIVGEMQTVSESSSAGYENAVQLFRERALERLNMHKHNGMVTNSTAVAGLIELKKMLMANKREDAKKHIPMYACNVYRRVEHMMSSILNMDTYHRDANDYQQMHDFAKNISDLTVGIMFFYPDFYDRCFENILIHLNVFAKQMMSGTRPDPIWMYDREFTEELMNHRKNMTDDQYYEALLGCGKLNPCIRKLRSMCQQTEIGMGHEKSVNTLWKDVCRIKMMKEIVSKHAQADSKEEMMPKTPIEAVCHSKSKMSNQMPTSMMSIVDGVVYRGALSLDNLMVTVQPIARCRCQKCDTDTHDKDDYDQKSDEWGDDKSGWEHGHGSAESEGHNNEDKPGGEAEGEAEGEPDRYMYTKPPGTRTPPPVNGGDPAKEQPQGDKPDLPNYKKK